MISRIALRSGSIFAATASLSSAVVAQPGATMIPQGIFYSTSAHAISSNGRFIIGSSTGITTGFNQFDTRTVKNAQGISYILIP